MAIIKPNGTLSGRVGELVYQYQKGMLTVWQRPASYRDKKTEVQLAQRDKMKAAQQLYRIVKEAVKGCFEFKKANQRDCDCFMSANILELGIVAQGTLPTLGCRFEDCHAVCDIIQEDWKEGDVLRIPKYGLPLHNNPNENGDLFCVIQIAMPNALSDSDKEEVEKLKSLQRFKQ